MHRAVDLGVADRRVGVELLHRRGHVGGGTQPHHDRPVREALDLARADGPDRRLGGRLEDAGAKPTSSLSAGSGARLAAAPLKTEQNPRYRF